MLQSMGTKACTDTEPAAAAPTAEEYQLLCSLLAGASSAGSGKRKPRPGRGGALSFDVGDGDDALTKGGHG